MGQVQGKELDSRIFFSSILVSLLSGARGETGVGGRGLRRRGIKGGEKEPTKKQRPAKNQLAGSKMLTENLA